MQTKLDQKEELRYARHLVLPQFGRQGQEKLKAAGVLVVGAGGLGCPLLMYLAAAGLGRIGIIDPDQVSLSNLQRQVLYTEADVGSLKVTVAKARLKEINPHVQIDTYAYALDRHNALELFPLYDVIADGTDNFATRYLINDACVLTHKVNVHGAIFRFEGQVSVFNSLRADQSRGPNYRDLFPEPPAAEHVPDCAEGGVLGVLPGIIGSLQATEVIKVLTGIGEVLDGRLLLLDTLTMETRQMKFGKRPETHIQELIDYEQWCGVAISTEVAALSPEQVKSQQQQYTFLDVRTPAERALSHIGGLHIPLAELMHKKNDIPTDRPLVVYCESGKRSAMAIRRLADAGINVEGLFSLRGGLHEWDKQVGKEAE